MELNIRELTINLTLIPVRAALTSSVPAAFWLSLQPQPIRGSNDREKEEERSGHTGRTIKRQRTGSRLSLGMYSRWRGKTVFQ